MSSYFRQQLENWLSTLEIKAERVLDIGGGANPVKNRVKKWDVKEYKILDNELEVPKIDVDYKCDINIPLGYYYDPAEIFEKFDVVFCLEVAEYWWNPAQAMKNIYNLLVDGGILYISFPFIYPHHNPEGYDYLRYARWGVKKLLKEAGFREFDIWTRIEYPDKPSIKDWFAKEKMHPCKNYQGHNEIGYLVKAIK